MRAGSAVRFPARRAREGATGRADLGSNYARRTVVGNWIKKILLVLVVAFVLFYLFTRPEAAAEAVRTFLGAFESIGRFFTSLAG